MLKVASLHYGVIFKKAFSKPHIFAGFVKDLTGIQLEIDTVETEKAFDPPIGKVDSRFDLFAEDKKNRIIVDIQYKRYPDHYHRFLHYHCAALLELAGSFREYRPNVRVLTIVILTSGDHHKKDVSIIDFDPKDLHGNKLGEIPHQVLYLCPNYADDKTPEPYKEWLYAMRDTLNEEVDETQYANPTIQEVLHTIERDTISPQERARMFDEYGDEQIKQDKFAKGKAEGLAEGEIKGKTETALAMLQEGLNLELIQKVTGLSLERLQQLKDS
ncbi:hypothetical protein TI05_02450 [Achromatium sp. WMS3]|nr:hypothetical protein TI05_02450 [Achromatium sp. WMS3]